MVDNTKVNHVEEQIFGAISVIAEKVIQGLSFDKTLLCTIVNDDKKKDGEYQVSDGTKEFTAYSSQTDYKKDQAVYVTIPNGDINQQKMIIGKYKSDEATPYDVTSPFDLFVPIQSYKVDLDTTTSELDGEWSLIANANSKEETSMLVLAETPLTNVNGYTRFGLKAKFKTDFGDTTVIDGEYGLRVILTGTTNDSLGTTIVKVYDDEILSSNDMFGNPYNFNDSYYSQEKVFNIEKFITIEKIKLEFYQKGNFKTNTDDLNKANKANLFVSDIEYSFGIDSSEVQEAYLQIYTEEPLIYSEGAETAINARWVSVDTDGVGSVVDSLEKHSIGWYKRDLSSNEHDKDAGRGWILVDNTTNFSIERILKNETEEHYKAILFNDTGTKILESNILYFTNINRKMTEAEANSALKIVCEDKTNGNYMIYRQGGALIDPSQRDSVRTLKVEYLGTELEEGDNIEWIFPKDRTMIDYNFGEEIVYKKDDQGNSTGEIDKKIKINTTTSLKPNYKIKNHYNIQDNNNTIMCKYTKGDEVYTAVKTLQFGTQGTSGSEYTMVVGLASGENAITAETIDSIELRIYDDNNNQLDLGDDATNYTISSDLFDGCQMSEDKKIVKWTVKADKKLALGDAQILTIKSNTLNLITYYPLAIRSSSEYKYISGPTQVIYSTSGEPNYSKEECVLYNNSNGSVEKLTTRPIIPSVYLSNNPQFIEFKDKWKQPILFIQNKYPSTTITQWDGENVKIDGGTILGTSFAAGTKNTENEFSGVMLGDWRGNSDFADYNGTGIFGFKDGELVYSINDSGKAYFKGEIEASSGSIGGWNIGKYNGFDAIYSDDFSTILYGDGDVEVGDNLSAGDINISGYGRIGAVYNKETKIRSFGIEGGNGKNIKILSNNADIYIQPSEGGSGLSIKSNGVVNAIDSFNVGNKLSVGGNIYLAWDASYGNKLPTTGESTRLFFLI